MNKYPKRELVTKDDGQCYGIVTKMLGNGRMMVTFEGPERMEKRCTVRGNMRRREWVHLNDVVLVALREFGDAHDIVRRYTPEEVEQLKRLGELGTDQYSDEENDIVFEDI